MSFPTTIPTPKAASIPTPPTTGSPTTPLLSCVSCRSRKIKCNKVQPACTACQRSKIDCVYPARTRLPRGKQGGFRARNVELSRRLNRLEGLVGKLGLEHAALLDDSDPEVSNEERHPEPTAGINRTYTQPTNRETILTSDGIRYLSNDFLASLSKEVGGLKQLLNEPSDDEEGTENNSPESTSGRTGISEYGPTPFIFGSSIETGELRRFHPPSPQMALLCDMYFRRCDPLFKILHKPSMARVFDRAGNNLAEIGSPGLESLMFAMYYAAVTSMEAEECMRYFREGKEKLLARYKYATEVALANADFLNSMELTPLQAFTIYLFCSRLHSTNRDVWALTSLVLRIAQALDLPRDGLGQDMPPFEAEMRRRLWWQINILDIRGSEDRGTYPMILENTFTTRQPLNINDEDIDPSTVHEPPERLGLTDMTFCLVICGTANISRRLNYVPPTASDEELEAYHRETERIVEEVFECMESRLLASPPDSQRTDMHQLSSMVLQICKKRSWLCCQYPLQTTSKAPRSDANREEVLATAIWMLEIDLTKKRDANFLSQWRWYGGVFVPWHPLSVVLVQLCLQTTGPAVEHAWDVVERIFDDVGNVVADNRKGTLWKPIKRLLSKAQNARAQALRNEMNALPEAQANIPYQNSHPVGVPVVEDPDQLMPLMPFGLPEPPRIEDQIMMQPEGTAGLSGSYIPQMGDMNLHPQDSDSINWAEWCEFVNSTWDPNQAVQQRDGAGMWNPQFGFWSV